MDYCNNSIPFLYRFKPIFSKWFNKVSEKGNIKQKTPIRKIALVGNPNVGKSLIFNQLTGSYVTVSNYPGTTIEIYTGKAIFNNKEFIIIDTPGLYSLNPISEEEKVTRDYLLKNKPDVVIHVVDAKNIERMLPLTLQLKEAGLPVILVLNMMDEAKSLGIDINIKKLEKRLAIPVVQTSASTNEGIDVLKERIFKYVTAVGQT